ncbi:hypothetical protein M1349_00470 [Patescibacteria group bacterium]|nr:hypothetical protein [Patescibacteria group bacterium]
MKKIYLPLALLIIFLFVASSSVFARIGVGVGTGKIVINQKLKPGMSYNLPPFTVVNTGDEEAKYSVTISSFEKQKELKPDKTWFSFSPSTFSLKPGKAEIVKVRLNLPVRIEPGTYFTFVEGFPIIDSKGAGAAIGIAAASKLYFTVIPGNIFEGIYYKVVAFWVNNYPWTNIIAIGLALIIIVRVLKRFVNVQVNIGKKDNGPRRSRLEKKLDETENE